MAKPKPEDIQKEIDEQEDEVYGTGYVDADPDKYTDTEDMLEDVIGNSPTGGDEEQDEEEEGFSIADEVQKDEEAIVEDKPEDKEEEEIEKEEENLEKEEEYVKSHQK